MIWKACIAAAAFALAAAGATDSRGADDAAAVAAPDQAWSEAWELGRARRARAWQSGARPGRPGTFALRSIPGDGIYFPSAPPAPIRATPPAPRTDPVRRDDLIVRHIHPIPHWAIHPEATHRWALPPATHQAREAWKRGQMR